MTFAQQTISGIVFDENAQPLVGVNVFIKETFEGASSDLDGRLRFQSDAKVSVTLYAGIYAGKPVTTASRNFFFVGVFITLGGNTAYDVSNF